MYDNILFSRSGYKNTKTTFMRMLLWLLCTFTLCTQVSIAQWSPGEPVTDDRDGQIYQTVIIGDQIWMSENLNIGSFLPFQRSGPGMSDNGIIERYCWENVPAHCDGSGGVMKRGGIYTWQEAVHSWSGEPQLPVRGICPRGWHIASQLEWRVLTTRLGGTAIHAALLEGGSSGFNAKLTGYCDEEIGFRAGLNSASLHGYFWLSNQRSTRDAYYIEIGSDTFTSWFASKSNGFSVRCICDAAPTSVDAVPPSEAALQLLSAVCRNEQQILLHFLSPQGTVHIQVTDILGREHYRSVIDVRQGENYHILDMSGRSSGIYILRLQSSSVVAMPIRVW